VQAADALGELQQRIAVNSRLGLPVSETDRAMEQILTNAAFGGGIGGTTAAGGAGGAGAVTPIPADFTGGTAPTSGLSTATGPVAGDQFLTEMLALTLKVT